MNGDGLHILHVMLSLDVGGLERNVVNQVRVAPRIGQRVTILCIERPGQLASDVEGFGGKVLCLNKAPGIKLGVVEKTRRLFREHRLDVVHTHQIGTLFYAGPAARMAGVPLVVHTEHGKERYHDRMKTRMLGRLSARFASTFFCLTEDMAASVRAARIVPEHKVKVIFNGIDTSQYRKTTDTTATRKSLNIPEGSPVIGTVGRLNEVKRQDVLLKGFAKLKARVPNAHLLLVGDGPLRSELEKLTTELGISDSVHFAGYQTSSAPYLQIMNVFALTSRSEGMPQAAIEALVTGVPVVASRVGGLPELIESGKNGILFPVGDDQALAEAFAELLSDVEKAQTLAHAGRDQAIARFDISRMASDYHQHFTELLLRRTSPVTA